MFQRIMTICLNWGFINGKLGVGGVAQKKKKKRGGQKRQKLNEEFLRARNSVFKLLYMNHFIKVYNNLELSAIIITILHSRNWGTARLSNLLKAIQLTGDNTGIWMSAVFSGVWSNDAVSPIPFRTEELI